MKTPLIALLFISLTASAGYIVKPRNGIRTFGGEPLGANLYLVPNKLPASVVEYQEKDVTVHMVMGARRPAPSTKDPLKSQQWALSKIGVDGTELSAANIVVGIVDTGVDISNEDLKSHLVPGFSAVTDSPQDDNGHGTHCAGVITAIHNNGIGVYGVSDAKVMPLKFLTSDGSGSLSDAIKAINYGVDHKVNVLSNSWGGGSYSQALSDVIARAISKGIVFVAAAGNESNDNGANPSYPASYDGVISVGASDSNDQAAGFSNYGGNTAIFAPGVNILSTMPGDKYQKMSGTSMATPHVAAAAALYLAGHPGVTPGEVRQALIDTSDDIGLASKASGGRLDIKKLLQ